MFEELDSQVLKIKDVEPPSIIKAVTELLDESSKVMVNYKAKEIVLNAKRYIEENSYDKKALETLEIYSK